MKSKKQWLSWLLSGSILLSMAPVTAMAREPEATPNSLLPLKEVRCDLDLTGYFPEELKVVPVRDVLTQLKKESDGQPVFDNLDGITEISWNTDYYDSDDFVTTAMDGTMDLSPESDYTNRVYLELIPGDADQLDGTRTRYLVDVSVTPTYGDIWSAAVTTAEQTPKPVKVYRTNLNQRDESGKYLLSIGVKGQEWKQTELSRLKLDFSEAFRSRNDLRVTVYQGYYETEAALEADTNKVDVTAQIWGQTAAGFEADYRYQSGYQGTPEFTVVVKKTVSDTPGENPYTIGNDVELVQDAAGKTEMTILFQPFAAYMYAASASVQTYGLYVENDAGYMESASYRYDSQWQNAMQTITYTLKDGLSVDQTYYLKLRMNHPELTDNWADTGINFVKYAVVGKYDTIVEVEAQPDIKAALFAQNEKDSYSCNLKNGLIFTIVDTDETIHHLEVKVSEQEEELLPEAPTPLSADTYFQAQGAKDYSAYVMSYMDDSYYYNGYQTVFLLQSQWNNSDWEYSPVDAASITPEFYTGSKVQMYASTDNTGAVKQESGKTEVPFRSGEPVAYSAAAENGQNLKNYWVTYVTQQTGGAKLFVNATNNPDHYNDQQQPVREIYLDDAHDYHHDIFLANIGDAELTGLTVTLSADAQNIALDDYWTIGTTKSLAPFTTTSTKDVNGDWVTQGELPNVAKIRLVPVEGQVGPISGKLTIAADGQDPVVIELTGIAGVPKITTETLNEGVKFVPYSSVIQTNNMNASDAIVFTLDSGRLPQGIELKPNGELYGVPKEYGEFPITVTASCKGVEGATDTKEFTLTILDNTNENVMNATDKGYELSEVVPDTVDGTTDQVFQSEGRFMEFQDFWLNGEKLIEGVDYKAEEGSTKITIYAQTFKNAGNGKHTIAAEFRVNNNLNGDLKRAAQNVNVSTGGGGSSGGGGSGSSSGGTSSNTKPTKPTFTLDTNVTFENGSVVFSKNSAKEGDTVTFTTRPNNGYMTQSVQVLDQSGREIPVTYDGAKYSFVMPGSSITVKAVFVKIPDQVADQPFTDIREGNWYNDAVVYVYQNGIMHGTDTTKFSPNITSSRCMVIMTLYNMAGSPDAEGHPFVDVAEDAYYAKAVAWAKANGIADGVGDGRFAPEDDITREQLAVLLYRFAQWSGVDTATLGDLTQFSDHNQVSTYALEAMLWANGAGIINGKEQFRLDPDGKATRAELATMLMRLDILLKTV